MANPIFGIMDQEITPLADKNNAFNV